MPTCQWLYVITFGGGLVEGDNISLDVKVGEHCTVVVTTQASTKVIKVTLVVQVVLCMWFVQYTRSRHFI